MQYEIEIRKRAEKDLAGIPKKDDQNIADAICEADLKDLRKAKNDPMNKQGRLFSDVAKELGLKLPCVVKPCCGGSSIGVTIVWTEDEFKNALDEAFKWEDNLIIEEYVEGREFSIGVIDYKALPVIEIAPIQGFYDYKNKYHSRS